MDTTVLLYSTLFYYKFNHDETSAMRTRMNQLNHKQNIRRWDKFIAVRWESPVWWFLLYLQRPTYRYTDRIRWRRLHQRDLVRRRAIGWQKCHVHGYSVGTRRTNCGGLLKQKQRVRRRFQHIKLLPVLTFERRISLSWKTNFSYWNILWWFGDWDVVYTIGDWWVSLPRMRVPCWLNFAMNMPWASLGEVCTLLKKYKTTLYYLNWIINSRSFYFENYLKKFWRISRSFAPPDWQAAAMIILNRLEKMKRNWACYHL